MSQGRVLVAYASRTGVTAGIAERIGEVLRRHWLAVDVLPAKSSSNIEAYQAVVLGSGVYAGNWVKDAAALLQANEVALANRPVWLFSDGPTGQGDPSALMKGWRFPQSLQAVADRIKPRDIAFFHGAIDPSKLNLPEKLIVKALRAPVGDFRDWAAIEAWADGIARALRPDV